MTDSTKEENGHLQQEKMEAVEKSERLSLQEHMFSWRGVIFFLLHFTFVAWCIPQSATSMSIVCINSRRDDVLRMLNVSEEISGEEFDRLEWGDNSTPGLNFSQLQLKDFRNVLGDINWSSETVGLVLSAPMVLSFIGPIISDVVMRRYGSRYMFSFAQLFNGAVMFASPSLARAGPYFLMAGHVIVGLTVHLNFPIIATLLTRWTPLKEKLTVVSLVFIGPTLGAVLTSLLNGYLCAIPIDNGWPFLFYVAGVLHVLFALAWFVFIADYPETHRFISKKEKDYIVTRRADFKAANQNKGSQESPYKTLLTSVPVLTFVFVFVCFVWTIKLTIIYIPIYLNSVHGFTPEQTGIAFSVICAIRILGAFFWSFVGNTMIKRILISVAVTRKACIFVGMTVAAVSGLAVSFFDQDNRWVAVGCIMLCLFCHAVSTSHLNCIPMDMAPRHAGTISSIASSLALLVSISGPPIVGALTPTGSYQEWRVIWYLFSAVLLMYGSVFLVFGQAKLQPWDSPDRKDTPQSDELLKT